MNTILSMRLISRGNLPQYAATVQRLHTSSITLDSSSSSSSDSDKASSKKKSKSRPVKSEEQILQERQETSSRLNNLLEEMMKAPKVSSKPIDLAVPPRKPKMTVKPKTYEDKVMDAAKNVANALGGDVKKTESDLLNKLLSLDEIKSSEKREKVTSSPMNLKELISGMKVDRTAEDKQYPPQQMRNSVRSQSSQLKLQHRQLDRFRVVSKNQPSEDGRLFDGKPLNIFSTTEPSGESSEAPKLATWEHLQQKEFKLAQSHPPENYFQELIQWTEQGKLWKFPIDNEQGLEEEQSVHFSDHVFMERHIKDWCPKRGPIRHFMELVCVGLSKNPYMTVNEKLTHIRWYQDFFASKQELLMEIGAIEQEIPQAKQLEAQ